MPELGDLGYEKESNIDTVPTAIVAVAVRDKPSPRRRRMAWPKRRRSEIDDGDATYPEKRSRIPRISAEEHIDDEMGIIAQGMESATLHLNLIIKGDHAVGSDHGRRMLVNQPLGH